MLNNYLQDFERLFACYGWRSPGAVTNNYVILREFFVKLQKIPISQSQLDYIIHENSECCGVIVNEGGYR